MADYNLVRDRVDFYVESTGLSRAAVNAYRKTVVSDWTTERDRRIARVIRGLERLWRNPEVTWEQWVAGAERVLDVIRLFFEGAIKTVKRVGEMIVRALGTVWVVFKRGAEAIEVFKKRHPTVWKILSWIAKIGAKAVEKHVERGA